MKHTDPNTDVVVFECDLPEPRDKVWRALTERDLLAAWLMPNDIRPEVGAKFQLEPAPVATERVRAERAPVDGVPVDCAVPVNCEILEAEHGRKLRWRQQEPADAVAPGLLVESVVTFELSDIPSGGTHLRIVHDGFTSLVTRCIRGALQTQASATVLCFQPRKVRVVPAVHHCLRMAA